jgi:hypothetical protein
VDMCGQAESASGVNVATSTAALANSRTGKWMSWRPGVPGQFQFPFEAKSAVLSMFTYLIIVCIHMYMYIYISYILIYTYTHIYIYMCVCVCDGIYVCLVVMGLCKPQLLDGVSILASL